MKQAKGFSSFEFYFVMAIIGLIVLAATQRYSQLGDETKRLSLEVLANNFNAAIYNQHTRWLLAQQESNLLLSDDMMVLFSAQGWPAAVIKNASSRPVDTITQCASLWNALLEPSPAISYEGGQAYGSQTYHLQLSPQGTCRYIYLIEGSEGYFFDYDPHMGKLVVHAPSITKNN